MKNKKRRTTLSKLMAFCMAAVMILSMSVTAFAGITDNQTAVVTVNGLTSDEGATVTAYKIADVNFDTTNQQLVDPVYTWVDEVTGWLSGAGYEAYIGEGNRVTDTYMNLPAADEKAFLQALETAMAESKVTLPSAVKGNVVGGTATLTLGMGQYMLLATTTGNQDTYQPLTANVEPEYNEVTGEWTLPNVTVSLKGSQPSIGKEVDDTVGGNDGSYAIGDTVSYKITADIPSYPLEQGEDLVNPIFQIGDKLSKGLTLDTNSVKVQVNDTVLEVNTYYQLDTDFNVGEEGLGYTFLIDFEYEKLVNSYPEAKQVTVTYSATVNENAFETDALGNDAFLGFANDPFDDTDYDTSTTEEDVYTYGFTVDKKDGINKDTALSGAQFELYEGNRVTEESSKMEFVKIEDGQYRLATATEDSKITTLEVDNSGHLVIQGLDLGTYSLKETKAPNGYILPEKPFTVVLEDANNDGILDGSGVTKIDGTAINGIATVDTQVTIDNTKPSSAGFTVYNVTTDEAGFQLPKTGGMGTMIFTVCGILLMGGAVGMVVILLGKKKRESR